MSKSRILPSAALGNLNFRVIGGVLSWLWTKWSRSYPWKFITTSQVLVLLLIPETTLGKPLAFSGLSFPTIY